MEAGGTEAAAGFADADPRMPALLADVAQRIVVPVTALCGIDPEPCDGSFALEAVGRVLTATLRGWAETGAGRSGRRRPRDHLVRRAGPHDEGPR
ncbi:MULTISPECIES: hypothetical protein [unclassified Streptomyces]|uniref:hypothetical protein n=1 Tax=unclassified Streptomyces TaxID=2593676 RepID=UPI0036E9B5C9